MRKIFLLGLGLIIVGCGGSGGGSDGGVMSTPPSSVAGTWDIDMTNSGTAKFTSCTGDLAPINGLTVAGVLAAGGTCTTTAPLVSQNGTSFTVQAFVYTCSDGSSGTNAGGGTVSGNSLTGQLDTISDLGFAASEFFTGTVSGQTLSVSSNRLSYQGSFVGSCNINPRLNYSGLITARGLASRSPGGLSLAIVESLAGRASGR